MTPNLPRGLQEFVYEQAAQDYLRSLPPEHFMEATAQAQQRAITLACLALIKARRRDIEIFNELLVQYPRRGQRKLGQVVPDNMVVRTQERIRARSSYNVPLEPAPPFWVMEYVSPGNKRKDYDDSFKKYERELKVRYYLLFYPDNQELTLFRHNKRKYVTVKPNAHGRYAVRELDVEVAILDGWVRYWYQGELVPLPAEMQRDLDEARQQADEARQQADEARQQADEARRQADEARRQVAEEKHRADELQQRLVAAEQELARLRERRGQESP
jgi:Uma2 family endonuclease